MSKVNYCVEPLSKKLIDYLAKHNKLFEKTDIDELPDSIKHKINESQIELNKLFTTKAFNDLQHFHDKLHYTHKFNFNSNDINYFMYKLRENSDLVKNSGYTNYSFSLTITDDTEDLYDGDSLYTLTIIETKTGQTGVYEKTVGRFD
jgi:hypothetical protein